MPGIWRFHIGSPQQIVYADFIEISQFHQRIHWVVQHPNFILGIGILADAQIFRDLLLCVAVVNAQTANVLKFHDFVSHIITR